MRHRLVMALLGLALIGGTALAQDASMEEKYQEKLKKDFVGKVGWVQSLDAAKAAAAKEGKLIFAYFSRSYSP